MEMAAFMFCVEKLKRFGLCQFPAALGIVFKYKIRKGLPDNHTHLSRLAGIVAGVAATTLVHDYIGRTIEHQIAGNGIRNDLLEIP